MKKLSLGWMFAAFVGVLIIAGGLGTMAGASADVIVYKAPGCQCCERWADHLRKNGLKVAVRSEPDLDALKIRFGVPPNYGSCHTARIGNYTIEGHVPASAIQKLLKEQPAVAGLAVAGMPAGAPGMEAGSVHQAYDVVSFDRAGHVGIYERH